MTPRHLARAKQHFDGQLIEPLVGQPAYPERLTIKRVRFERIRLVTTVSATPARHAAVVGVDLLQQRLDLGVLVPLARLLL